MPKKKEDAGYNLIQVFEEAKKITITPEKIEQNSKYISDNNGGYIAL